jgi:hypothetical protein
MRVAHALALRSVRDGVAVRLGVRRLLARRGLIDGPRGGLTESGAVVARALEGWLGSIKKGVSHG